MEEKKINKMLRRRFSGVGWTLLCYYGIVNLLVIVALVLDLARQGLMSLTGGGDWNPASAMDNGWGYLAAIGVGAVILHGWKGTEFFQGLFARRQKTMTAGTLAALLALCVGTQIVNSLWITLLEWIVSAFGLSVMETLEGVSGEAGSLSMFLYMGIFAPLSEEILFRGLVLDTLRPYGKRFAIFGSAVLFGLFHGNLLQTPYAFGVGLLLGYAAVEYSFVWAVVLHLFNNLVLADLLTRLMNVLPVFLQDGLYVLIFGGCFVASLVILGVKAREIREYNRSEWMDRRCLKCFFLNFGVLTLAALMIANMISLLFL